MNFFLIDKNVHMYVHMGSLKLPLFIYSFFFWLKGLILILIKNSTNKEHYKLATEANVMATSLISDRPFTFEASILTKLAEGGASKITKSSLIE